MSVVTVTPQVRNFPSAILTLPIGYAPRNVVVMNNDVEDIWVGGADVTSVTGVLVGSGLSETFSLYAGETLYAISDNSLTCAVTAITDEGETSITAISDDGTSVTYTCANDYQVGDVVTIRDAVSEPYNLVGAVVDTASPTEFTVLSDATGSTSTAKVSLTNGNRVTFTSTNTFALGDVVTISAATFPAYNKQGVVVEVSGSMFKMDIVAFGGATSTASANRLGASANSVVVEYSE